MTVELEAPGLRTGAEADALGRVAARAKVAARRVRGERLVERVDLGLREPTGADELVADALTSGEDVRVEDRVNILPARVSSRPAALDTYLASQAPPGKNASMLCVPMISALPSTARRTHVLPAAPAHRELALGALSVVSRAARMPTLTMTT